MPKYFNLFPKLFYSYDDMSVDVATNLTAKFKFDDNLLDNTIAFYEYEVADGETPEMIAGNIYGDVEKHWVILMTNNIINPQVDWLMDNKTLTLYVDEKYKANANTSNNETGLSWAKDNIKSYYKIETKTNDLTKQKVISKIEVDQNTYANLSSSVSNFRVGSGDYFTLKIEKEEQTYHDYELEENEKKRSIKILKREVVELLDLELRRVFSP